MAWMHYSSQEWVEARDLNTAINRLSCKLDDLSFDSLHAANYDLNYCFIEVEVQRLMKDYERYDVGSVLCKKYLYGIIKLEEFCEQMVQADLKCFLYDIEKYLPKEVIEKYQLDQSESEDDADSV